jgi:hypothetical protein
MVFVLDLLQETYQVSRVIHLSVRSKLSLDVLISKNSHLSWQMLAMGTEESAV